MAGEARLRDFYEARYTLDDAAARRGSEWRAVGARAKVDNVLELVAGSTTAAASAIEIGCGDGAVLAELRRRRPGWRLAGAEIAERPVALARERNPDADIRFYDGRTLPWDDDSFEVAVLSHVLEHVPAPAAVLAEAARLAPLVFLEVPLEANLSASRSRKRQLSQEIGHLHRFDRGEVLRYVHEAGLEAIRDLTDPLPREMQLFFAESPAARARASIKWAVRAGLHRIAPAAAERLFTLHYACLCRRR